MLRFISRRLLFVIPQALGVTLITFFLVRLLPGNPILLLTGGYATPDTIAAMQQRVGLNLPLHEQYWRYLTQVVRLDLGNSWFTGRAISSDIGDRLPATLELITIALVISVAVGIGLGVIIALRPGGIADKGTFFYGLLAGALPDFWLGLVLVFLFFFLLGWLPAPLGRLDQGMEVQRITGFLTIDTLATGNFEAFGSALRHLVLPVATLVFVYTGAILKMTRATLQEMLNADFVEFARACGLSKYQTLRYALRNALPPVVTVVGITYSYLLGGAVLVEQIYSWGGVGQYAVQAVVKSDYLAVQAFVLVAAMFNLIVYLGVDIIDRLIDPRLRQLS